jgi:serine/threonine protein kinase
MKEKPRTHSTPSLLIPAFAEPLSPLQPTDESQVIDDFLIMEQIGAGAFSTVHVCQHIPTGLYAAVKLVDLTKLKDDEVKGVVREVSVFLLATHPNLISLFRLSVVGQTLCFFMEFAPCGTLLEVVNAKKGLREAEAQFYFKQMFSAVRHLHLYHFLAHRDLKLENILITKRNVTKVADFGLAGTSYNSLMHTFVGTPGFQPPEIIAGNEYNEKCDVWSLGICLYAMVSGKLPFSTQTENYRLFLSEVVAFTYPPSFSAPLVDLLRRMLTVNPQERPTLMQLQNHPWLKGLEQLGTNIAPQPIVFHMARTVAGLARMRRRKTVPNPDILQKCVEMGIDGAQLTADLASGETTSATTTYFVFTCPVGERPEVNVNRSEPDAPHPSSTRSEKSARCPDSLPALTGARARGNPQRPSLGATIHVSVPRPPVPATPGKLQPLIASMRRGMDLGGRFKRKG